VRPEPVCEASFTQVLHVVTTMRANGYDPLPKARLSDVNEVCR
jgi:hypothetical protein